jgi:O-antigen ligase
MRSTGSGVESGIVATTPTKFDLSRHRNSFAYGALVVFCFLYFYRPEDFIPGVDYIPMAKISGILAFLGLIAGVLAQGKVRLPKAIKLLVALLFQMLLTIPFAIWRGGAADTVFNKFSKTVVTAILVSMVVMSLRQLRQLLWIQTSAVAAVSVASVLMRHQRDGRLEGLGNGILQNSNDLALNIAIVLPVCIAFMLHARGLKKAIWIIAMILMLVAVEMTYSRGGLLALIICGGLSLYEYGIKGKRRYLIGIAALIALIGLGIIIGSSKYRARVESIVLGNIEGSHDKNSREARLELLKRSISLSLEYPLFGVGPGNFKVVDSGWAVAHNTYTELSAEAGLLALVLFILALRAAFKNIAEAKRSKRYANDPDFRLFTQALFAGMAALIVGGFFASTEYNLYPYIMIGYTCALVRLTAESPETGELPERGKEKMLRKVTIESPGKPRPVWGR